MLSARQLRLKIADNGTMVKCSETTLTFPRTKWDSNQIRSLFVSLKSAGSNLCGAAFKQMPVISYPLNRFFLRPIFVKPTKQTPAVDGPLLSLKLIPLLAYLYIARWLSRQSPKAHPNNYCEIESKSKRSEPTCGFINFFRFHARMWSLKVLQLMNNEVSHSPRLKIQFLLRSMTNRDAAVPAA